MTDDEDIEREIKNMFNRTNMLIRKFNKCSVAVKTTLFKSYCLCFYDIALWKFKVGNEQVSFLLQQMCEIVVWVSAFI